MLRLCGFHVSNYHNKVRLALLEKDIPFEEDSTCRPSQQDAFLVRSPLERAKVRELIQYIELHMELVARRLYREVFFGGKVSDETRKEVERDLAKGVRGFATRAIFEPYVAGKELTLADCSAFVHLPLVSLASKLAFGRDFLDGLPQVKPYLKMLGERPAFARVNEDRKAAQAAMARK